jgi:hypothetical protein
LQVKGKDSVSVVIENHKDRIAQGDSLAFFIPPPPTFLKLQALGRRTIISPPLPPLNTFANQNN